MVGIASRSSLPGCELLVHGVAELKVQRKKRGGPVLARGLVGALDWGSTGRKMSKGGSDRP